MLNDGDVIGRRDLPAMGETALKAVVVRRVMAGGDDHAGLSTQVTDREAQLRRGAGTGEEVSLAAQLGPRGGQQLREVAGEMPDIMGDHEPRGGILCGGLTPEAQAGAEDVKVIQASRADCGQDGQASGIEFISGADPADCAAAHPPGAKGDTLIETIF